PGNKGATAPRSSGPLEGDIGAMAFMQAAALCQGLPENVLMQLGKAGRILAYGLGDTIFTEGATDDCLYLILEGGITVRKKHRGSVVELASMGRQGVFGEISVLTRQPRATSVVTRTATRVIQISGETVRAVAEASPKFGRKLAGLMSGRTKDTDKKLSG
ncbi:MAG: cyclic nucleotide-binding domain-containing protein, partial [Myxococcota bacterium]